MHVKRENKSCKPATIFFRHENLLRSASISRGVRSEVGGASCPVCPPPVSTPLLGTLPTVPISVHIGLLVTASHAGAGSNARLRCSAAFTLLLPGGQLAALRELGDQHDSRQGGQHTARVGAQEGEEPAGPRERRHVTVPHGGHRDDDQVQGVQHRPRPVISSAALQPEQNGGKRERRRQPDGENDPER